MASAGRSRPLIKPTELSIPDHFRCPISLDLMRDPVTVPTGITYDRHSIDTWLDAGHHTCPVTNLPLGPAEDDDAALLLVPNHSLRRMIQDWCVKNRSDRIPTPRIPVTPVQAAEILSEISPSDPARARELAERVRTLSEESERNRRTFRSAGSARVLAALFNEIPTAEILSAAALFSPLDHATCTCLCTEPALASIVAILKTGDITARVNALTTVKETLSLTSKEAVRITTSAIGGLVEALVDAIKRPISHRATKTAMMACYYLTSASERAAAGFADSGLVPLLLDQILEPDKGMCERALAVLDSMFSYEKGREAGRGHALTVPALVKKMFRVSGLATEFVVSAMWKLGKNEGGEEGVLVEAIGVGAFQKLLLLLQVGCSEKSKERATEMLKMMNGYGKKMDCIDVVDFKGLKFGSS